MQKAPSFLIAVTLAAAAGSVDAFGYRSLDGALVAHMSGNTLHAAAFLASARLQMALTRLSPIAGFVPGVAGATLLAELARRHQLQRKLALLLACELTLLVVGLLGAEVAQPMLELWSLSAAMGIQGVALRRVAGHDIRTTFITGMLVAFAEESVLGVVQRAEAGSRAGWLHLMVWCAFSLGAVGGSVWHAPAAALGGPALVVLTVALRDAWRPLRAG